jgi:hypothetical protein
MNSSHPPRHRAFLVTASLTFTAAIIVTWPFDDRFSSTISIIVSIGLTWAWLWSLIAIGIFDFPKNWFCAVVSSLLAFASAFTAQAATKAGLKFPESVIGLGLIGTALAAYIAWKRTFEN